MDQFSNILLSDLSRVTYQQDLHLHQFLIEAILTASGLKIFPIIALMTFMLAIPNSSKAMVNFRNNL